MTETITSAVATRDDSPGALVHRYRSDFATVLPSHIKPATWVRLAQGALQDKRNEELRRAARNNPASLLSALLTAARLGLEPGSDEFYLTPRKVKGQLEVLGIVGYRGEVELMFRAGAISTVIVEVVRSGDRFEYRPGRDERPIHDIDWKTDDRGDLVLVYAYAVMKDGATSKVVVLNARDIEAAKASSQGADSAYSPWQRHTEAMWLKTAAHRLAKWVPTSAEYIREQLRAARDVDTEQPTPTAAEVQQPAETVVEAELVEDGGKP